MFSFQFARYTITCLIYALFAPIPTHTFPHFAAYSRLHYYWDKFISVSLYLEHLIIILLDQNVQNEMLELTHYLKLNDC